MSEKNFGAEELENRNTDDFVDNSGGNSDTTNSIQEEFEIDTLRDVEYKEVEDFLLKGKEEDLRKSFHQSYNLNNGDYSKPFSGVKGGVARLVLAAGLMFGGSRCRAYSDSKNLLEEKTPVISTLQPIEKSGDNIDEVIDLISNLDSNSELLTEIGLISFLAKEYPELKIPSFQVGQFGKSDVFVENSRMKSQIEGLNYASLLNKFSLPNTEIADESILMRKAQEGWEEDVLLYGGNVTLGFLQEGDIISVLSEDIISKETMPVEEKESSNNKSSDDEVGLSVILRKEREKDGNEVLSVLTFDSKGGSPRVMEVDENSINKTFGGNMFVLRKDWGGMDPKVFDFINWEENYSIVQPHVSGYFEVEDTGLKLYGLDLYRDGYINRLGEVKEVLVPPGFKLNIRHGFSILRPDGSGVTIGFPDKEILEYPNWTTKFNSVAILSAWDSQGDEISFARKMRDKGDTNKTDLGWYQIDYGYIQNFKFNGQIGWNNFAEQPFYMSRYSSVEECYNFINYFYSKEDFRNVLSYELVNEDPIIKEIQELQIILNENSSRDVQGLVEKLKESSWYKKYFERRFGSDETIVSQEDIENIEAALRYVATPPFYSIPFQMGTSMLYPELGIQSVGSAIVEEDDGSVRGAITSMDLIPKELLEDPNKVVALSGYGGVVYRNIPNLEFLKPGDTIISDTGLSIVLGSQGHPEFPYVGGKSIYPIIESNRYGDGRIFLGAITEENWYIHLRGWGSDVFVLRGLTH